MVAQVLIPNAGQASGVATIVRWLKRPGDLIHSGDILLEVETDKATMEVEATAAGVLDNVQYREGDVVPVLTAVAVIRPEDATTIKNGDSPALGISSRLVAQPSTFLKTGIPSAPISDFFDIMRRYRPHRTLASPLARRLAATTGINLEAVTGSGPRGRVMKRDLREDAARRVSQPATHAPAPGPSLAPVAVPDSRWEPFSATRRTITERLVASVRDMPQVTLTTEVEADAFVEIYSRLRADLDPGAISLTDLFVKITATALRVTPTLNAWVEDDGIRRFEAIHIGLAVDTDRGLMVPVIRDADRKGLRQIGDERRDLADRARLGQLRPGEMRGATFTISNLGPYDIDAFTPIVNPPEGAILGVGRIVKKAIVRGDVISPGTTVVLSLTFDHRLSDGAPAARFLQQIKRLIEKPHLLLA